MRHAMFKSFALMGAAAALLAAQPNSEPNPYRTVEHWFTMPEGRSMGSTSSVFVAPNGHIWIAERCGANTCAGSNLPPILEFDAAGKLLKSFGANLLVFPHSLLMDREGNLWLTDGQEKDGKGHQVFKLNQDGKVLMALGKAGVAGDGPDTFNQPNSVAIAPDGAIFVSDGHNVGRGNARVVKFTKDGKFIRQWGGHGWPPDSLRCPTPWPSIRKGASSSATAAIIVSRSSIRTASSSKSGSNSADRAESSSTGTT